MTLRSPGPEALAAWVRGRPCDEALAREGAREMFDETRRLRAILATLARGGLGEGALVEFLRPTRTTTATVVVCCGSRDEEHLLGVVAAVVERMLGAPVGEATQQGSVALDDAPESDTGE